MPVVSLPGRRIVATGRRGSARFAGPTVAEHNHHLYSLDSGSFPMNKAALGIVAVVVAAVAAGAGYWLGQRPASPMAGCVRPGRAGRGAREKHLARPDREAAGRAVLPPGVPVEVVKVATASLPQSITTVGSLRSDESVTIRPEVAGRIARSISRRDSGSRRARLLLRLDPSINEAELLQAARQPEARAEQVRARGRPVEEQLHLGQARDEAENNLRVAEAAVALVEARLAKTRSGRHSRA